jgi:nucleotide-binding universal stress UspA family protein
LEKVFAPLAARGDGCEEVDAMIELKRILLPTDFSEFSAAARKYACAFADQFQAELHVLHVIQDMAPLAPEPGVVLAPPPDYMKELEENATLMLERVLDPHWAAGKTVFRVVRQGPPFLEIVRYAKETSIDLIVIGTHGRSGLAHVFMGSVAEKVVRKSPCPVLSVRHPEHEFIAP